jgi:type I restriction enzyme R subunit
MPANKNDIEKCLWSAVNELRGQISSKLRRMVRLNKTRLDYVQKFQQLIEKYNSGARNIEAFYLELISLAQDLNAEEIVGISEQLDEEPLALFDLLTRPVVQLTIEEFLDHLPKLYDLPLYQQKCQVVYQRVYDAYYGDGNSIYSRV